MESNNSPPNVKEDADLELNTSPPDVKEDVDSENIKPPIAKEDVNSELNTSPPDVKGDVDSENISPPDAKDHVDLEAVAAEIDTLCVSVNGVTTALEGHSDRVIAENKGNDSKDDLLPPHDFDAVIASLTHTQARLAEIAATLDTKTAKLYTAQLRATEARLTVKEADYKRLEEVNRELTETLNETQDQQLKHAVIGDFHKLCYDISQIPLNRALCISQETLPATSPERAEFYDPAHWSSLSLAARYLRIRGGIFAILAKYIFPGPGFRLVKLWNKGEASTEDKLAELGELMRDAGIDPTYTYASDLEKLAWMDEDENNLMAAVRKCVVDAIVRLLGPVFSPTSTDDEKESLGEYLWDLCHSAQDMVKAMLKPTSHKYGIVSRKVGDVPSWTGDKVVGVEGPESDEAGEILFTVFGGMSIWQGTGENVKIKMLLKAEVVVGVKKVASAPPV